MDRRLQKADLLKEATDGGLVHIEGATEWAWRGGCQRQTFKKLLKVDL